VLYHVPTHAKHHTSISEDRIDCDGDSLLSAKSYGDNILNLNMSHKRNEAIGPTSLPGEEQLLQKSM